MCAAPLRATLLHVWAGMFPPVPCVETLRMSQVVHVVPDQSRQRQVWAGDNVVSGYVVAGGRFVLPAGSLTLGAQSCEAYVQDAVTDELLYCGQPSSPVGPLTGGNGTYWVIIARDLALTLAGWTRQPGTRYLWQLSVTLPTLPPATQLLCEVTVTAGIIVAVIDCRIPASVARHGVYDVTDELYGAVPDGTTDTYDACAQAIAGMSRGGVLFFPRGSYVLSNHLHLPYNGLHVRGSGIETTQLIATAGVTSVRALLHFGTDTADVTTNATDCSARDLTLNGGGLCRPLQGNGLVRASFERLRCLLSSRAAAQFFTCTDLLLSQCSLETTQAADQYGDGLYIESCIRPKILHNMVYDFTRIGIVCEGNPGATCDDVLIEGNTIHYAHDNQAPESNAGIWVEHTDGATILNNHCFNLTNTSAGGTQSRGIEINAATDTDSTFIVIGNKVRDATRGISIDADPGSTVFVRDNTIQGLFTYGILLGQGGIATHIDGNFFEGIAIPANGGLIVISASGAPVGQVFIGPNSKGATTYANTIASDFLCFDFGTMPTLSLEKLVDWKVNFSTLPTILKVHQCSLVFDNTDTLNFGIGATNLLLVSDSTFGSLSGTLNTAHICLRASQGSYRTFNNCTFTNILGDLAYNHADGITTELFSCNFTNCQFLMDGAGHVFVRDSHIYSYPASGMFRGNDLVGYLEFHGSDLWITNAADTKCFVKLAHDPDVFVLRDVTYNNTIIATNLYDWTPNNGAFTTVTVP